MERLYPEDLLFKYDKLEAEGFAWYARALAAERRGAGMPNGPMKSLEFCLPHRRYTTLGSQNTS